MAAVLDYIPNKVYFGYSDKLNVPTKRQHRRHKHVAGSRWCEWHSKEIRCHTQPDTSSTPPCYTRFWHCTRKTKLGAAVETKKLKKKHLLRLMLLPQQCVVSKWLQKVVWIFKCASPLLVSAPPLLSPLCCDCLPGPACLPAASVPHLHTSSPGTHTQTHNRLEHTLLLVLKTKGKKYINGEKSYSIIYINIRQK